MHIKIFNYRKLVLVLVSCLTFSGVWAQSVYDLQLNEVLIKNDSLNVDDYGQHSSWIEIFNNSYNTVDIGGCYLTNNLSEPTKYWIPKGVPQTKIPSQCFILFWADGKPTRGVFHINFQLRNSDVIALFDPSGKFLIDKLELNMPQNSNKAFGKVNEKSTEWKEMNFITPATTNDYSVKISTGEKFVKMDPTGIGMTVIAMTVVFIALILLYLIFKLTGNFFTRQVTIKDKTLHDGAVVLKEEPMSSDASIAIAMALHLYFSEIHDEENTVLTIKKVSRPYSPWSSKIYTLRKNPR